MAEICFFSLNAFLIQFQLLGTTPACASTVGTGLFSVLYVVMQSLL